jgi:hypothetical protein
MCDKISRYIIILEKKRHITIIFSLTVQDLSRAEQNLTIQFFRCFFFFFAVAKRIVDVFKKEIVRVVGVRRLRQN